MRFLILSSWLIAAMGCTSAYKHLQKTQGDVGAVQKFKPAFTVALYSAQIDVVGNHLSGLLLIKKMPDSTTRIVFSNEMGFKFFDFEFGNNGGFKVYSIIKKMDRRSVITTLKKDFQLMLMNDLDNRSAYLRSAPGELYFTYPQQKGFNYYITDASVNKLLRLERASKRKTVTTVLMEEYRNGIPDTISVSHSTFNFTIGLRKIER